MKEENALAWFDRLVDEATKSHASEKLMVTASEVLDLATEVRRLRQEIDGAWLAAGSVPVTRELTSLANVVAVLRSNLHQAREAVQKQSTPVLARMAEVTFEAMPEVEGEMTLAAIVAQQKEWSERTFGPSPRPAGTVAHIRKELAEIEADPTDLREWVDVMILAMDGAWRAGFTPQQVADGVVAKQRVNRQREWPDWRTADPTKAIEHVRAEQPEPTGGSTTPTDIVDVVENARARRDWVAVAMVIPALIEECRAHDCEPVIGVDRLVMHIARKLGFGGDFSRVDIISAINALLDANASLLKEYKGYDETHADLVALVDELRQRRDDLLATNNDLLQAARDARAVARERQVVIEALGRRLAELAEKGGAA